MSLPTKPAALAMALSLALALAPAPSAAFCEAADAIAAARNLSVDEAVAAGLAADPGLRAAAIDAKAAGLRAMDAKLRMLPSLALSAGYTKLPEEPEFSLDVPNPPSSSDTDVMKSEQWIGGILQSLGSAFDTSITDSKDIRVDLQYPVFAGFRLREAAEIARLQSLGKGKAEEVARRALTFEIRRAYWETARAHANVETLSKALELEKVSARRSRDSRPRAWPARPRRLGEEAKVDQAEMALDEAGALRDHAFLVLSALVGDSSAASVETVGYELASAPAERGLPADLEPYAAAFSGSLRSRAPPSGNSSRPPSLAGPSPRGRHSPRGLAGRPEGREGRPLPDPDSRRDSLLRRSATRGNSRPRTSSTSPGLSARDSATTSAPCPARSSVARRPKPTSTRPAPTWSGSATPRPSTSGNAPWPSGAPSIPFA